MSALRSAIDEMVALSDDESTVEQLDAEIDEIAYARDRLAGKARSRMASRDHHASGAPGSSAPAPDIA